MSKGTYKLLFYIELCILYTATHRDGVCAATISERIVRMLGISEYIYAA